MISVSMLSKYKNMPASDRAVDQTRFQYVERKSLEVKTSEGYEPVRACAKTLRSSNFSLCMLLSGWKS